MFQDCRSFLMTQLHVKQSWQYLAFLYCGKFVKKSRNGLIKMLEKLYASWVQRFNGSMPH